MNEYKFYINKFPQILIHAKLQPMRRETQIRPCAFQHPTKPVLKGFIYHTSNDKYQILK